MEHVSDHDLERYHRGMVTAKREVKLVQFEAELQPDLQHVGREDRAQAQAFTDTWVWDDQASEGFQELTGNEKGRYSTQTVALIKGLRDVLTEGSLPARTS